MKRNKTCRKHRTSAEIERGRREFLGRASCAVFAAMAASGIAADRVSEFSVLPLSAAETKGAELSYELPVADEVRIDKDNDVILIRSGNRIYAFALACPHENTALRWQQKEEHFQCPRHKSTYQPDGTFISGRPTRNMDRFALRLANGMLAVDLSTLYRSDENRGEWESAVLVL